MGFGFAWVPSMDPHRQTEYNMHQEKVAKEIRAMEEAHLAARRARSVEVGKQIRRRTTRKSAVNFKKAISSDGRVKRPLIEKADKMEEKVDSGGNRLLVSVASVVLLGGFAWVVRWRTEGAMSA